MPTPDGRPFSELNQANDLRDDDFLPMLRPSEPLADDQNVIISGRRVKEILGDGSGGTPGPSLPLYASPGTHVDGPMHQLAATLLANRGPNARPDLRKGVRFLTNAEAAAAPDGGTSLEAIDPATVCLFTEIVVEFYRPVGRPAAYGQVLVAAYDGRTTPDFTGFRDASFAVPLPLKWVPQQDAASFVQPFALDPAGYQYTAGEYRRGYVTDATEEQFFKYIGPGGTSTPPTLVAGNADWQHVNGQQVPTPIRPAWENIVGDPQDSQSLTDYLGPLLGQRFRFRGDFATGTPYDYLDVVSYNGTLYFRSAAGSASFSTFRLINWSPFVSGLYDLTIEIKDPPQTGTGISQGFTATAGATYLFSAGGTARIRKPSTYAVGGVPVSVRLAANATAPLLLYFGTGTGNSTTVQPGELVSLNILYPNNVSSESASFGEEFRVISRSAAASTGGGTTSTAPPTGYTGQVAPKRLLAYGANNTGAAGSQVSLLTFTGTFFVDSAPVRHPLHLWNDTGIAARGMYNNGGACAMQGVPTWCNGADFHLADMSATIPGAVLILCELRKTSDDTVVASATWVNNGTTDVPAGGPDFDTPTVRVFAPAWGDYYAKLTKTGPGGFAIYKIDMQGR